MKKAIMHSETFLKDLGTIELSEKAVRYLESEGLTMVKACVKENGKGLNFDETVQDCLIAAAKAIMFYDASRVDCKLSTFIWNCCANQIKMEKRRLTSVKQVAKSKDVSYEQSSSSLAYSMDGIEEFWEHRDKLVWLQRAIDDPATGLTDEERKLVLLTMQGFTQYEIGDVIGISQSTVSVRLGRAIQKLVAARKSAYQDEGEI
ncbi:sigma-70 family RNA polymerase sigma factor [uncultured Flavonifractor sp.]|uniref:sigma-70 family RNA polymerase sigma factor n=1 Tax=uncultured Flavonifractor sp. TaxID=1193534 RepID=UPI00259ADC53|nr:sigma-70 family RNA polymerase sigma factor [uncultured Flavonifractor sp.]